MAIAAQDGALGSCDIRDGDRSSRRGAARLPPLPSSNRTGGFPLVSSLVLHRNGVLCYRFALVVTG